MKNASFQQKKAHLLIPLLGECHGLGFRWDEDDTCGTIFIFLTEDVTGKTEYTGKG